MARIEKRKHKDGIEIVSDLNSASFIEGVENDETRIRMDTLQAAADILALLVESFKLYFEVIKLDDKRQEWNTDVRIAHHVLMVDSFNCLLAARTLLTRGYYGQVVLLLRPVLECISRMALFQKDPSKAREWLHSGKQIQDAQVRKQLDSKLADSLRETFSRYSRLSHMNTDRVVLHAYQASEESPQRLLIQHLYVGPFSDSEHFRQWSTNLISTAVIALAFSARPFFELLDKTWHDRNTTLLDAVQALIIRPGTSL